MTNAEAQPSLPALTSARFLAALVVVLHHFQPFIPFPPWLGRIAAHGQAGVAFFFVLSGFILAYNYHGAFADGVRRGAWTAFMRARFARIYPMHLVTLVLATPITLVALGAFSGGPHPSAKFFAATWLAHALLLQAWVPVPTLQAIWNAVSWSISAELLFYLAFPAVIAWAAARRGNVGGLLAWATACWALEAALAVVLGVIALGGDPWPVTNGEGWLGWIVSAWAPLRLGEFVVGCLLGVAFLRDRGAPSAYLRPFRSERGRNAILAIAMIACYAMFWLPVVGTFGGFVVWVVRHHVLFVPCFAAAILALASGRTFLSVVLERPPAILLGEASYGLYLLHGLPVLVMLQLRPPGSPWEAAAAMAATIGCAILAYRFVETPARRWLRGGPAAGGRPRLGGAGS